MYTQQDDKRNTLWSLLQEQSNKKCMDCTAQNPSFACATLGTFVCVRCAELLREFGVQVKSVVSSSFSEDEIKYLLQQGNAVARHRWLARWTPAEFPEPSHDESSIRVRQFMVLKYREKKWASTTASANPVHETPKLVDIPFLPAKPVPQQQPDGNRSAFPVDFGSPPMPVDYASPLVSRKEPPAQQAAGFPADPFPISRQASNNPFVTDPPAFTPIMSPPNHPQSPSPQEPPNPFLPNYISPAPSNPSSPSQIYLSSPPPTTTPHPTPLPTNTSSNQLLQAHPLPLNLTPTSPQPVSPPIPNIGAQPPVLNGIGSPISSPLVSSDRTNSQQIQQQQQQQLQQQLREQQQREQQQQQQTPPVQPTSLPLQSSQALLIPQSGNVGAQTPVGVQSNSTPTTNHAPPLARASSLDDTSRMLEEVRALKQLFEMQMMGKEEYEARRIQLIDSLTKTKHENAAAPAAIEPRLAGTERAIRHRYDVKKGKWCHTATIVIIEQNPFAEGAMRKAYRMRDLSQEGQLSLMVAKIFKDTNEDRASYFKDVEMQMQGKEIAERFNRRNPPKKVDFVSAFVYELVDRPNKQICSAEYYIDGKFEKHNNNFGYINDDTDRNTPQVFSHFSYEDSNGQLIVVDIQGVGDVYTDPQIHTLDGQGYGRGNLGAEGINKFFSTHACNQICHFFGLTAVNPKQPLTDAGTKPQSKLNHSTNVDRFNFGGDVFDVLRAQPRN